MKETWQVYQPSRENKEGRTFFLPPVFANIIISKGHKIAEVIP